MEKVLNTQTSMSSITSKEERKEDYALEKVPQHYRMNWWSITNVAIGVATALVFMQMGSLMAVSYGSVNALLAEIYATVITGVLGIVIAYFAAKSGLNVNLMARGGGYGYIGASITSFIYAINFIMYCAIEGAIMAGAVYEYLPQIPLWVYMIFFGLVVIPFNWFGVRQLDQFQKWSLPIFIILLIAGMIAAAKMEPAYSGSVWTYLPENAKIGGIALLTCIGTMNGLVGIVALLLSDYARFIKWEQFKIGVFAVGFIPPLVCFFLMGVIGIWFGVRFMEANPGVYFVQAIGIFGALFSIITQFRINITNLYSGSLSLSNFFENVFNFKPGRTFWVVFVSVTAIISMLAGILDHLGPLLTFQGVFLFAWAATIVADAIIVKKVLKLGPNYFEYRREYLYAWNPVGVTALIIASILGTFAAFGFMGTLLQNIAAFFAGIVAFILVIVLALVTQGKYYAKQIVTDHPVEEVI
ncbi:MAG: permease [Bacillus thermozeamaize]|uniref:Permease n=1 Tax=Bacillus thermozeamaize TaxID=230954 RepID=A0A1Y3PN34_9BACI|nr:MAG: permease [Bacillus thermozeamaize]